MSSKKNPNFTDLTDQITDPLFKLLDVKPCIPEHCYKQEFFGNGRTRVARDDKGLPIQHEQPEEIRVATVGNVDAGKSSTVGTIKTQEADNGKGKSRLGIFRHKHEIDSGRTSAVGNQAFKYQNRLYSVSDLAGHEGYMKTTLHGIVSVPIDAVMLTVSAVDGMVGMAREHFGCAHNLNLNVFVAMTKMDAVPKPVFETNLDLLQRLIKHRDIRRIPVVIRTVEDLQKYYDDITRVDSDGNKEIGVMDMALAKRYVPIFLISNVSLKGMNLLQTYIFNLHPINDWEERKKDEHCVFVIDRDYNPKGVGLVVSGIVKYGSFKSGETYMLGPFTTKNKDGKLDKKFYPITIRNVRNNCEIDVAEVEAGVSACFNIVAKDKDIVTRTTIQTGMCITNKPSSTRSFRAKIKILHHASAIKIGYEPHLHVGGCKETIKIMDMDKEFVQKGNSTNATLKFKHRYSYIDVGDKFIFREGKTRGSGEVLELID